MNRFMVWTRQLMPASICLCFLLCGGGDSFATEPADSGAVTFTAAPADASVTWFEDFDAGWNAAKRSRRPMVIFITSDRCRYCDAMKQTTWSDAGVLKRIRERFVAIRLSPGRNAATLSRIKVPMYPMTLIGHPDGHIVDKKTGYQPATELVQVLDRNDTEAK